MCLRSHFLPFLASAASTLSLQVDILSGCTCSDNVFMQTNLSHWESAFGADPDVLLPKQPFWDRPGITADIAPVKTILSTPWQLALFLAASSPRSRDWLHALPISSCGLRLDDEAVRIGVGLRLGLTLCVPHKCHCGTLVDAQGLHGFVCKKAPGRSARHAKQHPDPICRFSTMLWTDAKTDPQTHTDRWLTGNACDYRPLSLYKQQHGLIIITAFISHLTKRK